LSHQPGHATRLGYVPEWGITWNYFDRPCRQFPDTIKVTQSLRLSCSTSSVTSDVSVEFRLARDWLATTLRMRPRQKTQPRDCHPGAGCLRSCSRGLIVSLVHPPPSEAVSNAIPLCHGCWQDGPAGFLHELRRGMSTIEPASTRPGCVVTLHCCWSFAS